MSCFVFFLLFLFSERFVPKLIFWCSKLPKICDHSVYARSMTRTIWATNKPRALLVGIVSGSSRYLCNLTFYYTVFYRMLFSNRCLDILKTQRCHVVKSNILVHS